MKKDIPSSYDLIHKNAGGSVNIGRAHLCAALGELPPHACVHIFFNYLIKSNVMLDYIPIFHILKYSQSYLFMN